MNSCLSCVAATHTFCLLECLVRHLFFSCLLCVWLDKPADSMCASVRSCYTLDWRPLALEIEKTRAEEEVSESLQCLTRPPCSALVTERDKKKGRSRV
jgi:hypothetical protein